MNKAQENLSIEQELDNSPIAINKEYENNSFNWLTDHSRNFLAAGYIPEGTTPEGRIKEIAERACARTAHVSCCPPKPMTPRAT